MSLNRRRLLLAGLGFTGLGLAALARNSVKSGTLVKQTATGNIKPIATTQKISSAPQGLSAPPVRGDVRIIVISDLNSQYGSTTYELEVDRAIKMIPDWQADLVICGGDMVAGQKHSLSDSNVQAMWEGFDQHIAAPLRRAKIPLGFTVGNHDASGTEIGGKLAFARDRQLAQQYWQNHDPGLNFLDRQGFPFYYTFTQNNVFYLVWDASCDTIPPEQIAWAQNSLNSPEAKSAKLRLVLGHLPLYGITQGRDNPGNYLARADELHSLLERNDVHTYISGHDHAYYPAKSGQLELLYTGALGTGPRKLIQGSLSPYKTLTVVDIDLANKTTIYTTYNMTKLSLVDITTLPKEIKSPTKTITRRDLASA
jgi:hypothetical protein